MYRKYLQYSKAVGIIPGVSFALGMKYWADYQGISVSGQARLNIGERLSPSSPPAPSSAALLIRLICSNFSKHQTDHDIASYARLVSWDKISQFLVITASQSAGEVCRAFPRLCTIFCLKLQAIFCNTTIIRRCLSRALSSSSLAGNSPGSLFNYR